MNFVCVCVWNCLDWHIIIINQFFTMIVEMYSLHMMTQVCAMSCITCFAVFLPAMYAP